LWLLLALLGAGSGASAQSTSDASTMRLTVTFAESDGKFPPIVCAVIHGDGDLPLTQLPGGQLGTSHWSFNQAKPTEIDNAVADATKRARNMCGGLREPAKELCINAKNRTVAALKQALQALSKDAKQPGTAADVHADECAEQVMQAECATQAEFPGAAVTEPPTDGGWTMTCGGSADSSGDARVAIVRLEAPKSINPNANVTVGIRQVEVDGNVAAIELQGALRPGQYLLTRLVGGTYAVSSNSEPTNRLGAVKLQLAQRCDSLRLPVNALSSTRVTARLERDDACRFVRKLDVKARGVDVLVPRGAGNYKLTLNEENGTDQLTARFSGAEDASNIRVERSAISFSWTKPCAYPTAPVPVLDTSADPLEERRRAALRLEAWCPHAELVASGIACSGQPANAGVCAYTCAASLGSSAVISVPTPVRFSGKADGNKIWTELLLESKAPLSGYIPSEQRTLRVVTPPPARGLEGVILRAAWGDVHDLPADGLPHDIEFPSTACSEDVTYQYYGSRSFQEEHAKATNGALPLAPPSSLADGWTPGFALQAGGGLMFAEPFAITNSPWAYLGFASTIHFWNSAWSFEQRFGFQLGTRPYAVAYDAPYDASDDKAHRTRVTYYTFSAELLPVLHVSEAWSFAPFGGVALGYPLFSANADRVDGADLMLTGGPLLRYGVTRAIAVEFLLRLTWFEDLTIFHSDLRGQTTTELKRPDGWGAILPREVMGGIGLRFGKR
jgi:hypothetical protein